MAVVASSGTLKRGAQSASQPVQDNRHYINNGKIENNCQQNYTQTRKLRTARRPAATRTSCHSEHPTKPPTCRYKQHAILSIPQMTPCCHKNTVHAILSIRQDDVTCCPTRGTSRGPTQRAACIRQLAATVLQLLQQAFAAQQQALNLLKCAARR